MRCIRTLWITLLLLLLLPATALADSGPKPQLTVRVSHPPEELYYLDLLERDEPGSKIYGGFSWGSNTPDPLDQELLDALLAAVPEGWHACTAQGTIHGPMNGDLVSGSGTHVFSYAGVPDEFRILMVTRSGQVFLSDPCTRQVLQETVQVDWAAGTVSQRSPLVALLLQFLSTLAPTLLIEGVLLWGFKCLNRRNLKVFLLVNVATQLLLTGGLQLLFRSPGLLLLGFLPLEILILVAEALLYRRLFTADTRDRAANYAMAANICSAVAGFAIAINWWEIL